MSNTTERRILFVEDNEEQAALVKSVLVDFGIVHSKNIEEAQVEINRKIGNFELILCDMHLPDGSAFEMIREIRSNSKYLQVPIFVVTADTSESLAIKSFDIGVDDYLFKPIKPAILKAKINAYLTRVKGSHIDSDLFVNPFRLSFVNFSVFRSEGGVDVNLGLTPTEFKILAALAVKAGDTVTRQELHEKIWGTEVHLNERALDQHISTLRRKLDRAAEKFVKTVHGVGYKLLASKELAC